MSEPSKPGFTHKSFTAQNWCYSTTWKGYMIMFLFKWHQTACHMLVIFICDLPVFLCTPIPEPQRPLEASAGTFLLINQGQIWHNIEREGLKNTVMSTFLNKNHLLKWHILFVYINLYWKCISFVKHRLYGRAVVLDCIRLHRCS